MSTLIRYKTTGSTRRVADFAARRLIARGIATLADNAAPRTYLTRHMEASPVNASSDADAKSEAIQNAIDATAEAVGEGSNAYGDQRMVDELHKMAEADPLDSLSADELRVLADQRGINYHHRAGVPKLLELLKG
jgi:hypothetical protein